MTKIGIRISLASTEGGAYQYNLCIVRALSELRTEGFPHELVLLVANPQHPQALEYQKEGWTVLSIVPPPSVNNEIRQISLFNKVSNKLKNISQRLFNLQPKKPSKKEGHSHENYDPNNPRVNPALTQWLRSSDIDLLFFTSAVKEAFEIQIPSIAPIHDLGHWIQPEFPEVSLYGEWQYREYLYRNIARTCKLILCESQQGCDYIHHVYKRFGLTPDRLKILKYIPYYNQPASQEECARVRQVYQLPERYLFYPAQFWAHKNHPRLIQALSLLKDQEGLDIPIVLSGSASDEIRKRNLEIIHSFIAACGLEKNFHFIGQIPDENMNALFTAAEALVYVPMSFSWTNIPPMEAWACGCPVIAPDTSGMRDQAGDAALFVDVRSVESISAGIRRIWLEKETRDHLVDNGYRRLKEDRSFPEFKNTLEKILLEAAEKIKV